MKFRSRSSFRAVDAVQVRPGEELCGPVQMWNEKEFYIPAQGKATDQYVMADDWIVTLDGTFVVIPNQLFVLLFEEVEDQYMKVKGSSNVVGFGTVGNDLVVDFIGGDRYRYFDVPYDIYVQMLSEQSKGSFVSRVLAKGPYRSEKVEHAETDSGAVQ